MMASGRLADYLGMGVIADRPVSLTLHPEALGLWWATDTEVLSVWDGVAWEDISAGGGGVPGGADTQVQFNDAGAFAGESTLTYNKTTNTLTVEKLTATGLVTTVASATGSAGLVIPHGAAPTAPVNGDMWTTSAGLFVRINGVTVGPLAGATGIADGDYGDVAVTSGGSIWTVDNDTITNAKLANMATATIKGRITGSTGDPEDLTAAQAATVVQGDGLDADAAGFRGIPQNSQSGNYTCVAADAGKEIYHPSGAGAGDTFTLPANGSVAYEIGTAITFTNMDSNALSIAITTDTMYMAGAGTTGTRTLAQYGTATAVKKTSTTWLISGINLT